jgi:seryl-tRNA synthetase
MLELRILREDKEAVLRGMKLRNLPESEIIKIDRILELDDRRKVLQKETDQSNNKRKTFSKEIGMLFKQGKREEAEKMKAEVTVVNNLLSEMESEMKSVLSEMDTLLLDIPNVPNELVPPGNTDEDNVIVKPWEGAYPQLGSDAIPHWELAKKYNIIDFELGTKITGSGFVLYRGAGAKLERALISFFLDEAEKAGYEEIAPPLMVNEDTARGTGQLPDKEGQMYHVTKDDFYLIPTAEVPLTNIYRDVILNESELPVKVTGYTPCFRREAGSYGSHVKGLNRLHQFDKVEIVRISKPENSYAALDEMVEHVSELLNKLELPYRIVRLCAGDLGFTSTMTYDFEVFSAAQKKWLEVSSVSNFLTFQSNRMKLRYRKDNKNVLAHTLNGSALALARIVAALLENNQCEEGIKIPAILQSYMGMDMIR